MALATAEEGYNWRQPGSLVPTRRATASPWMLDQSVLVQRVRGLERLGEGWLVREVVKRLRRKLGGRCRQSQIHPHRATGGVKDGGGGDT